MSEEQIDSTMKDESPQFKLCDTLPEPTEFKQVINKKGMPEKSAEEEAKLKEQMVTYISYEELTDFELEHPFMTGADEYMVKFLMSQIGDNEMWRQQFDTLDVLRRIHKFHPDKFLQHLGTFNEFLKLSVQNLRSGIAKNSLMLSNEFLATKVHSSKASIDFVAAVLPSILHRTVYDKKFISLTAVAAMREASSTCLFLDNLHVLFNTCFASKSCSKQLVVNCFLYATPFIKNCELSLLQQQESPTIKLMVQMIAMGVDAMPNIKKAAIETAKTLKAKIGEAELQQYLENVLNSDVDLDNEESKEDEKNKKMVGRIMANVTEKKKVVREKPNFKAFVQKQKTLVAENIGEKPQGETSEAAQE